MGWFSDLGPYATVLATTEANGQPALVVIEDGAISPGSGRVVIVNDTNALADSSFGYYFPTNETMFLNTIDYALVPEPSGALLAVIALFGLLSCQSWRSTRSLASQIKLLA